MMDIATVNRREVLRYMGCKGEADPAAAELVESLGGEVVKIIFLMELAGLKGRERLKGYNVASVICYDGK